MKKPMNKKLKIIIICASCVVVIIAAVLIIRFGNIGKTAEVYPVAMLNESFWGENENLSATVSTGKLQQVTLKEGLVKEIKVKEGDIVKKGDVLMLYDQTSFQITLMKDQANIASCEAAIAMCDENIQKYSRLKPKEEAPEPYIEIIDHGELPVKYKLTASDDVNSVILFDTTISKEFLEKIKVNNEDALLQVYNEMIIPGGKEQTLYGTYEIKSEDLVETDSDWILSNIIKLKDDGSGVVFDTSADFKYQGAFSTCTPKRYERYEQIIHYPEETDTEDYLYTRAELAQMIRDEANESSRLKKELIAEKINYEMDKNVAESGEVKASIDGTVSKAVSQAGLSIGDIILEVKGSDKYVITTYINEMDLSKVAIGDKMNVTLYERGLSLPAKVVEIGKEPSTQVWGGNNPNVSYYPVMAEIEDEEVSLNIGEWGEATLDNNHQEEALYIPIMYVRKDQGGRYVMKNANGHLKKQYVTTGKIYSSYVICIKDNLTLDDYISFPYDTGAIQGVPTKQSEDLIY